jgi:Flp pilus assembly protein TadG
MVIRMRRRASQRRATRPARSGYSSVEFAMTVGLFLVLALGAINVSRAVFDKHGLMRASEEIARNMAITYDNDIINNTTFDPTTLTSILTGAQKVSDIPINTSALSLTGSTTSYTEWSNGSVNGSTVYVCGVIDSSVTGYTGLDMLQVTITAKFTPIPPSRLIMGGQTVVIGGSSTSLTADGESAGTDASGSYFANICPSH